MSIHWNPKGEWGGGTRGFSWSELRLMLIGGVAAGLVFAQASGGGFGALPSEGGAEVRATAIRVIDGDTFDHGGMRVRIADIDAPEVRGRCAYETDLAGRATRRLRALLASGEIALHRLPDGRDEDRHGRKLRIVTRDGRSVGDTLVAEGLARTWTGRREPWCV